MTGSGRSNVGPAVGASFRAADHVAPGGLPDLLGHARAAERHGFHDFDAADHVLLTDDASAHPGDTWTWGPDSLWPDPLILLTAVAATTTRIGLTTSIYVAPLRPAVVVAKMAATLDALAGGRLRLGLGSGWAREEFAAVGVPYEARTERLEDAIGACRALWTSSPATFASGTVSFERVWAHPRPPRPGGIPILLGGPPTARLAERVARLAEGWNPMAKHRPDLAAGVGLVRAALAAAGRDPRDVTIRVPLDSAAVGAAHRGDDPGALRDEVASLAADGATDVKLYVPDVVRGVGDVEPLLRWVSDALELGR